MEFRRIAATIYKSNLRWRKAVALAKQDKLYKVRSSCNMPSGIAAVTINGGSPGARQSPQLAALSGRP